MDTTVIREDLEVNGNLSAKDSALSIEGKVTGDIDAKSLEILSSGRVKGSIVTSDAKISGALEGSVKCSALTLEEGSKVKADITAGTMTMTSGARLVGRVEIDGG